MASVEERVVVSERERLSQISWGAVIAGLVLTVATTWLLTLLGIAIGVSVADATDTVAIGNGFGTASTIWMVLTGIAAFFVGGLLAGRLAGKPDQATGMLHGVTLWGTATVLALFVGTWSVTWLAQSAAWAVGTTASAAVDAADTVGTTVVNSSDDIAAGLQDLARTEIGASVAAELKQQSITAVAEADPAGGADVSRQEIANALRNLEQPVFEEMARELTAGETQAAKTTLREAVDLTDAEIDEIVEGVSHSIEDSAAVEAVRAQLQEATTAAAGRLAKLGGPSVNRGEVRKAINQIDRDTMWLATRHLVNGRTEAAEDVIVANTNLSDAEVEKIVTGANEAVKQEVAEYRKAANEAVEVASSYSQAVVWSAFAAAAIGLLASIGGGWVGAETVERLGTVVASREVHA